MDGQIDPLHRHRYITLPVSTAKFADSRIQQAVPKPYLLIQLDPSVRVSIVESDKTHTLWWRHIYEMASGSQRTDSHRREKRSSSTMATPICGTTVTQCCRESLYVSFHDVGWDDWILAPSGFHAFYCRGSCRTFTAAASSANTHASVLQVTRRLHFFIAGFSKKNPVFFATLQKLLSRDRVPTEARPHLAPCCAPTRLSPLIIFYSDESDVIRQRSLPNMIVESCGCAL